MADDFPASVKALRSMFQEDRSHNSRIVKCELQVTADNVDVLPMAVNYKPTICLVLSVDGAAMMIPVDRGLLKKLKGRFEHAANVVGMRRGGKGGASAPGVPQNYGAA